MLSKKQNFKELQLPPLMKGLHNFNFLSFNQGHCNVCDRDFFFPLKKCLGTHMVQTRPNESEKVSIKVSSKQGAEEEIFKPKHNA